MMRRRHIWSTCIRYYITYKEFMTITVKAMAPHSSALAWKIPWVKEPGGLQYMGLQSQTRLSDFTFTFHFHALEKEMATHSSVFAWRIPGMAEPGGLPSMGSHRVGHGWNDLAAAAWQLQWRQWHPTPVLLPGKSHGWRSLVGCSPWGCWVGHDWATWLSLFTFMHMRRKWQPTPVFMPGES